jgi:hypothetical protein
MDQKEGLLLHDLAREALAVQDASNLSGVVLGFSRAIASLRQILPSAGTDAINTHPVCVLWADKVAHLTGTQTWGHDAVMRAYQWAHDAATATGMYDHAD